MHRFSSSGCTELHPFLLEIGLEVAQPCCQHSLCSTACWNLTLKSPGACTATSDIIRRSDNISNAESVLKNRMPETGHRNPNGRALSGKAAGFPRCYLRRLATVYLSHARPLRSRHRINNPYICQAQTSHSCRSYPLPPFRAIVSHPSSKCSTNADLTSSGDSSVFGLSSSFRDMCCPSKLSRSLGPSRSLNAVARVLES